MCTSTFHCHAIGDTHLLIAFARDVEREDAVVQGERVVDADRCVDGEEGYCEGRIEDELQEWSRGR